MAKEIQSEYLLAHYPSFLIDAYGVLVRAGEVIPRAIAFNQTLVDEKKEFLLLSNDATLLAEATWKKYSAMGFKFSPEQIITSGSMIRPFFQKNSLQGARTLVFGPA